MSENIYTFLERKTDVILVFILAIVLGLLYYAQPSSELLTANVGVWGGLVGLAKGSAGNKQTNIASEISNPAGNNNEAN